MPDVYGVLEELKREWVCHPLNLSQESKRRGLSRGLPKREAGRRKLPGKWQLRSSATPFSPDSAQLEERPERGREAGIGSQEVLPRVWPCLPGTRCQPILASILRHLSQASEKAEPPDRTSQWKKERALSKATLLPQQRLGGKRGGRESRRLETLRLSYLSGDTEEAPGATDQMSQDPWRPALPQSRHGPGQDSEQWLRTPGLQTQHWGRWARLRSDRTVQPLWMGARAPGWGRSARVWQSPPDGSATPPQHPPAPPSRVVLKESAVRVQGKKAREAARCLLFSGF